MTPIRLTRSSGILLHPTSLPGPCGSGDLGAAAYHFVDWLAAAGQSLWQMLPIGGIGPGNSPYMSTSAFAGNLLLVDLAELRRREWLTDDELRPAAEFNQHRVDYGAVHEFRMSRLRLAAKRFFGATANTAHDEFTRFCDEEKAWLDDYALFMALTWKFDWRDWMLWDAPLARRDAAALRRATKKHHDDVSFWKFGQWCFFRQWHALKRYANDHGVRLVGDIPIFIAYQSADVWANQHLFELDEKGAPRVVAGVPPDFFSDVGQRWGNPLYRWAEHERDGYAWWIERLRRTMAQVDMVRIDHFRGFAGYWEIPAAEPTAIHGRWAAAPGEQLLAAINQALGRLPIIAEDLGVITDDVVALRDKFGLPGMRVLQFAFGDNAANPFLPHNYLPNTVVYPGTHDNNTAVGWWAALQPRERAFASRYLASDGASINWDLIHAASSSVADVSVIPLQDVLGLPGDCRMNLPGKASGYWEWRFTWDQIAPWHAEKLAGMAAAHGRCAFDRARLPA